jgi:hypothetical protein
MYLKKFQGFLKHLNLFVLNSKSRYSRGNKERLKEKLLFVKDSLMSPRGTLQKYFSNDAGLGDDNR